MSSFLAQVLCGYVPCELLLQNGHSIRPKAVPMVYQRIALGSLKQKTAVFFLPPWSPVSHLLGLTLMSGNWSCINRVRGPWGWNPPLELTPELQGSNTGQMNRTKSLSGPGKRCNMRSYPEGH